MGNSSSPFSGSSAKSVQSPFPFARAKVPGRQAIALLSVHSDPAAEVSQQEAGGRNVYVHHVGEALCKLGWQVDMFTRKISSDQPTIVEHSSHCRTIRLTAGPLEFLPRDDAYQWMPAFVDAFRTFQSKDGANYPLIHTNDWLSAWVGLQLKAQSNIQVIHTYHSLGAVKYQGVDPLPAIAQTRLQVEHEILENADCVVATSPQEEELLRSHISPYGCIEVIPCGTDLNTFHTFPTAEARAKLGFSPTDNIVLYVGRFDSRKGVETLIQAIARLRDELNHPAANGTTPQLEIPTILNPENLRLVIVGSNDPDQGSNDFDRVKRLVDDLGLQAQTLFTGQVGHDMLPLYYTAADVCVVPSQYEPFGLVAIEAMACGTPVVASDIGGLRFTVVPEETGLLVPPQNVDAFAFAIARVLTDEVWAQKLRRTAPTRVQENFSWNNTAAKLSDLYRRLLAQTLSHELLGPAAITQTVAVSPLETSTTVA